MSRIYVIIRMNWKFSEKVFRVVLFDFILLINTNFWQNDVVGTE